MTEHANHADRGVETGRSSGQENAHVHDLHVFLGGPWIYERKVFDGLRDEEGTAHGEARFMPEGEGLRYRENGELVFGETTTATEREYIYGFPAHGVAEVRFTDGRFFHMLDLTKGIVRVEHQCGEDTYHGLFRALTNRAWLSVWRVQGPNKSQVITTHYLRP